MSDRTRAVFTGRGVLSTLGCDWPAFAESVRSGRVGELGLFPNAALDDSPQCYLLAEPLETSARPAEPLGLLATRAVEQALAEAAIQRGDSPLDDVGLIMNTFLGPSQAIEAYLERLWKKGPRSAHPALFVDTLLSMPASKAGIAFQLRGSTAVLGGSSPFELALVWLRSGRERTVVAGGGEYLSPKCLRYHRELAKRSGDAHAPLSQGAAFVVLETAEQAERREVAAHAQLLGAGAASEPQEVAVPWSVDQEGRAFAVAMRAALADADVAPDRVTHAVLASGDETSERGELEALQTVLGAHARSVELLRPKLLVGEALGASAGISLLYALAHVESSNSEGLTLVNCFEMGGAVTSLLIGTAA